MSWLFITLFAYFLNAISMVIDKTILRRKVQNPFVYTFYIAAFGAALVIIVVPLIFLFPNIIVWPGISQFWISLLAGATFSSGLFLMFFALRKEDASRLTPMIGGLVPIFVFILAHFFLGESLLKKQIIAFVLIAAGAFFISLDFNHKGNIWIWLKQMVTRRKVYNLPHIRKLLWLALPSALSFAICYTLTKDVYNHQPFISGFVWTRIGCFIAVLLPMLWAKNRYDLLHQKKDKGIDTAKGRFLFGQASGGLSALLIQYAISIASVSLVQALQGTQYVFVFLAVLLLTYYYPRILKEEMSRQIIIQKIIAILLIGLGVWFII